MTKSALKDMVLMAQIGAPHGVRGLVKLRSFTGEPDALLDYGPLVDPDGREIRFSVKGRAKGDLLVAMAGIEDREAAAALKGTRLYVARSVLPEPREEEYYQTDLLGLACVLEDGSAFGEIKAVEDFGAGDLLEIKPAGGGPTFYLPFTREVVPLVDLANRRVQVVPPESVGAPEAEAPQKGLRNGPGEKK